MKNLMEIVGKLGDSTKERLATSAEYSVPFARAVISVAELYCMAALGLLAPLLSESEPESLTLWRSKEAWIPYLAWGQALSAMTLDRLMSDEELKRWKMLIADGHNIVKKIAFLGLCSKTEPGDRLVTVKKAMNAMAWCMLNAPEMLREDSESAVLWRKHDTALTQQLEKFLLPYRNIDGLGHVYAHCREHVESSTAELHELVTAPFANGSGILPSLAANRDLSELQAQAEKGFSSEAQRKQHAEMLKKTEEDLKAAKAYLLRASRSDVPEKLTKELHRIADHLCLDALKPQAEFAEHLNGLLVCASKLQLTLEGHDIEKRDAWSLDQGRIDLVVDIEKRTTAMQQFVANHRREELECAIMGNVIIDFDTMKRQQSVIGAANECSSIQEPMAG